MARRKRRTRLTRKEEARSVRKAVLFGFLTLLIALGMVFMGIPALIRLAVFLGEIRSSSQPIQTEDIMPPPPVRLQTLPEATNSAQIKIEGFAEPGSTVALFLDSLSAKEVVVENDGSFIVGNFGLNLGENDIYAVATDKSGNKSQTSEKFTVVYDNTPPEIEIIAPAEGEEISGEEGKITLQGKTEPKASVLINERVVIVNSEGNFDYPLTLSEGENTVKIMVTDKAGNKAEKEIKLTYSP